MSLYPLLMAPSFRCGAQTPWGGTMLRDLFLKDAPEDVNTGEALEVSCVPGEESLVLNGVHAGKPLTRMVSLWGEELTGPIPGDFPLLLKFIDTYEPLSVQVHPSGGVGGQARVWVILSAEPDARIVYGLNARGEDLSEIVRENRLGDYLHWEPARPSDVFYIPGGTAYALGAGIQCYELQPTGSVTYRLWDWDRVDGQGQRRALNTEAALQTCAPDVRVRRQAGVTALCKGGSRTYYVSDDAMELCRLNVSGSMPLEGGRMKFLTALEPCALKWADGEAELPSFQTAVIPAAMEDVRVEGQARLMMSSLPDREALRAELTYRADGVAGLEE